LLAEFKRLPERIAGAFSAWSLFANGRGFLAVHFLADVIKKTTMARNVVAPDEPIRVGRCS
jgi:hypothetical protein